MFKVNNKVTSIWHLSGIFIVNLLLTYFTPCSSVSIVNFEQVNAGWAHAAAFEIFPKWFS